MGPAETKKTANDAAESGLVADGTVLERFVRDQDEASFAALVRRFGPLVLAVCRRVLRHEQDAEDAFQATFFVLARKARSIRQRESVGSWLYGVALRMACKAKSKKAQQPVPSPELPERPTHDPTPEWVHREVQPILDEEVNRLPNKYRQAFVLCYLEGKTNEQAAQQLGCPTGTMLSRLSRAREKLRGRLTRRGIVLSAGALTSVLGELTASALPNALVRLTAQQAVVFAAKRIASVSLATGRAAGWAEAFLKSGTMARWKIGVGTLATAGLVTVAVWWRWNASRSHEVTIPAAPPLSTVVAVSDRDGIQGIWKLTSMKNGPNLDRDPGFTMEFAGDQFRLVRDNGQVVLRHVYWVEPDHDPPQINFIREDGVVMLGIYALAGDDVKFCFDYNGKNRPTRFETPKNANFNVFVARRQSSARQPAPD